MILRRGLGCLPYRLTESMCGLCQGRARGGEGQSQEKLRGAGGWAMGRREGRSASTFILRVRLVGLEDGLDEDREGMEGSGRLQAVLPEQQGGWRGKSKRVWQGRLGTASVCVKLEKFDRRLCGDGK